MRFLIPIALSLASSALAQPFQLIVTVTPPGSNGNPANWQPTLRINVDGTGGSTFQLPSIPNGEVFDPAGVTFRSASDLFIGNRHGNVLNQGSISRFTLSPDGQTATQTLNFTAPGMVGVHELAYDATRDQLFAACVNNGVYRFGFDNSGNPVFLGSFAPGRLARGVAVHPNGGYLYMTAASGTIYTFALTGVNGATELAPTSIPGASNLHFFCISPDARHLYAGDIGSNVVLRFRLASTGELTLDQTIPSPSPIDLAFSPDYNEMFVGSHFQGGITRYRADANLNWTQSGLISTPSMGGFGSYVSPGCVADFNFDGAVDFFDYDDYVRCFEGQACPPGRDPDINGDITVDFFDYDYFVQLFETGC